MEEKKKSLWGKRFIALFIDVVIVTLILYVLVAIIYPLLTIINLNYAFNFWPIVAGLIMVVYFTYLERHYGATFGKKLMNLQVESTQGTITSKKLFLRNLSKFLWIPLIFDVIVGVLVGAGDRYLDQVSKTKVVSK